MHIFHYGDEPVGEGAGGPTVEPLYFAVKEKGGDRLYMKKAFPHKEALQCLLVSIGLSLFFLQHVLGLELPPLDVGTERNMRNVRVLPANYISVK